MLAREITFGFGPPIFFDRFDTITEEKRESACPRWDRVPKSLGAWAPPGAPPPPRGGVLKRCLPPISNNPWVLFSPHGNCRKLFKASIPLSFNGHWIGGLNHQKQGMDQLCNAPIKLFPLPFGQAGRGQIHS